MPLIRSGEYHAPDRGTEAPARASSAFLRECHTGKHRHRGIRCEVGTLAEDDVEQLGVGDTQVGLCAEQEDHGAPDQKRETRDRAGVTTGELAKTEHPQRL